jgi:nitroreductase
VIDREAFLELLRTQRAVRLFTDQPVDDETIHTLIAAAVRAPNGANVQPWHFIVVRDHETKVKLGEIFDDVGSNFYGATAPERTPWKDVPVIIVVCTRVDPPHSEWKPEDFVYPIKLLDPTRMGPSIFPAVQNLLLTAHALGLGSVLTTRLATRVDDVRAVLGIPEDYTVQAALPIGWPAKKYGRSKRKPVREVTSREKWGQPW